MVLRRVSLTLSALLASYAIVRGQPSQASASTLAFTVGFGALTLISLFLLVLGSDFYQSAILVIMAGLVPVGIALGLLLQFQPSAAGYSLVLSLVMLALIILSRRLNNRHAAALLAAAHAVAGIVIVVLPLLLVGQQSVPVAFLMISLAGLVIGAAGIMLLYARVYPQRISAAALEKVFPIVLLLMTTLLVIGYTVVS